MAKILVILICSLSIFTLIICALDKFFAIKHKRRVPEAVLIVLSAAGGSLGMLIGMYLFHHKNKKAQVFSGRTVNYSITNNIMRIFILQRNNLIKRIFLALLCLSFFFLQGCGLIDYGEYNIHKEKSILKRRGALY